MASIVKTYYQLTKPGIVYGNDLSAVAGFLLAAKGHIHLLLFVATMIGISLVIGSACVFNNYIDRDLDKKMKRTKNRAFAAGEISARSGLIYGAVLGVLGFFLLALFTNWLTVIIGLIGYVDYIVFYGIGKRKSIYGTIIGSISGSMPIVAGYTAVTNRFDLGAFLLFLILTFWQMPHFYAIAVYRLKDYAAAGLPVLPVKKGIPETKVHMLLYVLAFVISTLLLSVFRFTGVVYTAAIGALGVSWIWLSMQGFKTVHVEKWARKMFFFSLIALMVISVLLSLSAVLP